MQSQVYPGHHQRPQRSRNGSSGHSEPRQPATDLMIHVNAIITPCGPAKSRRTSHLFDNGDCAARGIRSAEGWAGTARGPGPELPAITRTGLKATATEVVVSS